MRGSTIGRRVPASNPVLFTKHTFSSSSGRGRGGPTPTIPTFEFVVNKTQGNPEPSELAPTGPTGPSQPGLGHGRGKPLPSDPTLPAYSSFVSSLRTAKPGPGHGRGSSEMYRGSVPPPRINVDQPLPEGVTGMPSSAGRGRPENIAPVPPPPRINLERPLPEGLTGMPSAGRGRPENISPVVLPQRINVERPLPEGLTGMPAAGRGKPLNPPAAMAGQVKEENRHTRVRPKPAPQLRATREEEPSRVPPGMIRAREDTQDRGRPEGGRGRGRGRGEVRKEWDKGRGRGRGRGRREQEEEEEEDENEKWGMDPTDDAEAEKFAQKMGAERMTMLEEAFQEAADKIMPSAEKEDFIDALHTNCMIEFEPEYLMGEFNQNPDIDEKPPMPLRDFLEKVKPFMMAYEGIQTQEEWEEAMEEVMKDAPMLKEIVDYYSGPDRITSKKQQEELDKLANTVPAHTPAALKQFTNRAVLSLQSNPGWKYNKKYQFMDKLVREVQQFK